jgi:hypothetical protein
MSTRGGAKDADRFAGLNEQSLIVLEALEGAHDGIEAFPITCGATDASVDHELARVLGHLRVQIVVEHPQSGFLLPTFASQRATAGCMQLNVAKAGVHAKGSGEMSRTQSLLDSPRRSFGCA